MAARPKLVVGNWKMNGSRSANAALLAALKEASMGNAGVCVCPPSPYLADVATALGGSAIRWGAQDCACQESGAFTGDVSAAMLADLGCTHVIVGHSERRALHGESDALVAAKAKAAIAHGLVPIVCVGETIDERESGATESVVLRQLAAVVSLLGADTTKIVLAYEPVWAIGGHGRHATVQQAEEAHAVIRHRFSRMFGEQSAQALTIQYGGSVKPENAAAFLGGQGVDGVLIGGASLQADQFLAIIRAGISIEDAAVGHDESKETLSCKPTL